MASLRQRQVSNGRTLLRQPHWWSMRRITSDRPSWGPGCCLRSVRMIDMRHLQVEEIPAGCVRSTPVEVLGSTCRVHVHGRSGVTLHPRIARSCISLAVDISRLKIGVDNSLVEVSKDSNKDWTSVRDLRR